MIQYPRPAGYKYKTRDFIESLYPWMLWFAWKNEKKTQTTYFINQWSQGGSNALRNMRPRDVNNFRQLCYHVALSWCYHVAFVTLCLFSRNQEFSVLRNWVCNTSLYEINCSFGSQESPCSSLGCSTTVLPLDACKEDLTAHLVGLCVSGKRGWRSQSSEITEKELLLNRAG